jgi:mitogen-activated protein kinase kinase kinase 9
VTNCFSLCTVCWEPEAHDRPSFEKILMLLDEVARSPFAQTPHESFHTMQEDWKMEIEAMFDDIRVKEKVIENIIIQFNIFISNLFIL